MKKIITGILSLSIMLLATSLSAQLYKGLDAEGNVVYSDKPFEAAEKYAPPPISVVDGQKKEVNKSVATEDKPKVFKYRHFNITSPKNKETIRNIPELAVSLKLVPALNVEQGHNIWLLVDGRAVVKNSQSTSLNAGRLERGVHKLQAQVRNSEGKVVVRSRTNVVFIQRTSAL